MTDKIELKDIIEYSRDIVIRESELKPRKTLVLHMKGTNNLIAGPGMELSYRVIDSIGKIRFSDSHFDPAVKAYNKLYSEL